MPDSNSDPSDFLKLSDRARDEYRHVLQEAEAASQSDYDKAVMTLSGGALGVTFAFFKDFADKFPVAHPNFIIWAWVCWVFSLTTILISFYTSARALRRTIEELDSNKLRSQQGGLWNRATQALNFLGGAAFVIGVVFAICFVYDAVETHERKCPSTCLTTAAAASAASSATASTAPADP